jgi:selenocysteine-specific elongation factor
VIIGTAGHIDHGKSALVRALTGREMDPLAEERRRGITLDLHFAPLALPDGAVAGVVDVPGHEDLIRTMVAGAAGLDLVLLIVAADEGIMPQTREHLAIVEQLRVPAGIPVLTKVDLVGPEWLALVNDELTEWLAGSVVPFGSPVATSATTGSGLAGLRARIAAIAASLPARDAGDLFRLPVDRALSLPGVGTVVTGTAWSGRLRLGDPVRLLPGGAEARVRSLERHGQSVTESAPGDRVAAGLSGVDRAEVRRGDVLVKAGDPWLVTSALDVRLELLPSATRPLVHHARVRVHHGTLEALARVQLTSQINPGGTGLARLALETPLVARGGDRLVLRSYSPADTIGGGWVVDPLPPRGRPVWPEGIAVSAPAARLPALVQRRPGGLELDLVSVVLGPAAIAVDDLCDRGVVARAATALVDPAAIASSGDAAMALVQEHHRLHPAGIGMPLETLRQVLARRGPAGSAALERLAASGQLVVLQGIVREPGFQPRVAGGDGLVERMVRAVEAGGLTPPSVAELEDQLGVRGAGEALRLAARESRVVMVERDRFFSPAALRQFCAALEAVAANGPITPPALREQVGLSRKFLIPLLEWADRSGLTRRDGDRRIWQGGGAVS